MIIIGYRFGLRFTFEVMRTDGDCGLRSHGNKQLRQSFAADSKSQVQWDSTVTVSGVALHQHSAFRDPQSAFPMGQASRRYQSLICHLSFLIAL
jgi:hypothetical protein